MVNITTEERDSRAYVRANGHFTQVPVHDVVIEPVKGWTFESVRNVCGYHKSKNGRQYSGKEQMNNWTKKD
jgi:hypothetical protein